jgi:hypothetical protein
VNTKLTCGFVGDVLVVGDGADDLAALGASAAGPAPDSASTVVVIGPEAGTRSDLAEVLPAAFAEWLGGCTGGLWLTGGQSGQDLRPLAAELGSRLGLDVRSSRPRMNRPMPPALPIIWRPEGPRRAAGPRRLAPSGPTTSVPGKQTPAGWSFHTGEPLCAVPVDGAFLIELEVGPVGPRMAGRPATARTVAAGIAAVRDHREVVLLLRGRSGATQAAEMFVASLVRTMGAPIVSSLGPVFATSNGALLAPAGFRRWLPVAGSDSAADPRTEEIGRFLPAWPVARFAGERAAPTRPPALARGLVQSNDLTIVDAAISAVVRADRRVTVGVTRADLTVGAALDAALDVVGQPARSAPARSHRGVPSVGARFNRQPASISVDDRSELRRVLNGRYDSHARAVSRMLAEHPGLRSGGEAGSAVVAGLVAVQAYHAAHRELVNSYLRQDEESLSSAEDLVARCAVVGMGRLPAAHGAVFAVSTSKVGAEAANLYRAGDEIVEPGFIDVGLTRGPAGGTVEYAIWSASARRLGPLGTPDGATAVFPPGSRFAVLAVDPAGGPDQPLRVLLQDRTSTAVAGRSGPGTDAAPITERLRAASKIASGTTTKAGTISFAVGLDGEGSPFQAGDTAPAIRTPAHATAVQAGARREDVREECP